MSKTQATKGFWLATLRADGAALRAAASQPGVVVAAVPSCPDWTMGDLLRHVGAVYRRTRDRAGSDNPLEPWGRVVVPADAPAPTDDAAVTWFAEELAALDAFLETLEPDQPAWNWAPQAKVAAFWHRRMAHETAVHRWDAQLAAGLPEPIEAKLAGDTVAEALDTFLPAGRRAGSRDVVGMAHLMATDIGQEWHVRLRGEGVALLDTATLLDADAHPARATASGSASDLALALWGRVTFDVLDTAGDAELLASLRVT